LGKMTGPSEDLPFLVELSTRPEVIELARECADMDNAGAAFLSRLHEMTLVNWQSKSSARFLCQGSHLEGFVREVMEDYVWILFSPTVSGRAFLPQFCNTLEECEEWRQGKGVPVGMLVSATVVSVDAKKRVLDVILGEKGVERKPETGSLVTGTIISVGNGGGVLIRLGHDVLGKVALSDIHDEAVDNALVGLEVGQFVRGKVVDEGKKDGRMLKVALSLKPSMGGQCLAHTLAVKRKDDKRMDENSKPLVVGDKCAGYITNVGNAGVFVSLSRSMDARIKLRQLSDEFLEDPKAAFPVGMYVCGTVIAADDGRIEMTLRRRKVAVQDVSSLKEGQIVNGHIRRVENYGVFVDLGGGLSGLAHVSQLTDGFVKDVAALFKPGQQVMARVMEVNNTSGRIALGLKPSYFEGEDIDLLEKDGVGGSGDEDEDEEDDFEAELGAALEGGVEKEDVDLDEQLLEMEGA